MKTTGIMIIATAALTGLTIVLWNRMITRQAPGELSNAEPRQRSRHISPVFSKMKQQVQENL